MSRADVRGGMVRLAIGLASSVAMGACGSAQPSSPAISNLKGPGAALSGAGSTFDQPFFDRAFDRYHQLNPGVSVDYAAQGSSFGIQAFQANSVNFGASDVPMTRDEMAQATGGPVVQVPVALGGEAVSYNLQGVQTGMHLTGSVLADIYLGRITRWDDSAIAQLNPTLSLPNQPITVVHRSDGSGTTYIFTDFLSSASQAWVAGPGKGRSVAWPTGVGASGNQGVASEVRSTPGAIGYVELAYALRNNFTFARMLNSSGFYVLPVLDTVVTAAAQKPNVSPTDFSIVNEPGNQSYPISGYSWVLVYQHQPDAATGQALVKMLDWLTQDDGQAEAKAIDYVPLPSEVSQLARSTLAKVTDDSGTRLLYR
jgi:phosphate transport system substrate-binding protein